MPGLAFAENLGQWEDPALFVSKRRGAVLRAEPDALWIDLRGPARDPEVSDRLLLRFAFAGASDRTSLEGEVLADWKQHYFLGRDSERWRGDVPVYERLRWRDLWPGIDLVVEEGEPGEILAYRLELKAGADPTAIAIRIDGVEAIQADAAGRLVMTTSLGPVSQTAPRSFELEGETRAHEHECRFRPIDESTYGFEVDGHDPSRALVIDPGLIWATYLGGSADDQAWAAAARGDGTILVTGYTWATDFPTTPGSYQISHNGAFDGFVSALDKGGSALAFSTYVGGSASEGGRGIALDSAGSIVFAGGTGSADYPVTPGAYDTVLGGTGDAHVTKLSADGSQLLWATYAGGSGTEGARANLLLDVNDEVIFAGATKSHDFPVTPGALFPTFSIDSDDGFLARLSADGQSLLWSTYIAGKGGTQVVATRRAPNGDIVLLGWTLASNFPTTVGAFDETFDGVIGLYAGVVMRIGSGGNPLVFSTYFEHGVPEDLDVDSDGRIALVGNARPDLPVTPGAFSTQYDTVDGDSFVAILAPDGGSLPHATFLGGVFDPANSSAAIELADSGVITVQFPGGPGLPFTPGAHAVTGGFARNGYFARLSPKGDALLYASYIGGGSGDLFFYDGLVDGDDRAVCVGAHIAGFPVTPGAFDPTYGGASPPSLLGDGVVAKMELQPTGAQSFGNSTPSCKGPIRLHALGPPAAGLTSFAVAASGAPPGGFGLFALSGAAYPPGLPVAGVTVYLDLLLPPVLIGKLADSFGYAELPLAIPAGAAGQKVAVQSFWLGTASCGGLGSIGASDALRLSIH